MPVDNNELKSMIQLANEELTKVNSQRSKIVEFMRGCTEILQLPKEDDPETMKDVMDDSLAVKMTPARRQIIYDKLKVDKVTLGL